MYSLFNIIACTHIHFTVTHKISSNLTKAKSQGRGKHNNAHNNSIDNYFIIVSWFILTLKSTHVATLPATTLPSSSTQAIIIAKNHSIL